MRPRPDDGAPRDDRPPAPSSALGTLSPRPGSSSSASRASPTAAPRRPSTATTSSASTTYPGLGRLAVGWRETHGSFRAVFRGYVERTWGTQGDETDWVVRQGYLQYWWGEKVGLRVGKQRIAWGSGFAWNPTNRLEPPKNALNTTLEQEGALAARLDWAPAAWASVVLVGATTDATPRDLPVAEADVERRDTAALRARFLVKDTDVALVASAGKNQRTLFGLDVGRDLGWAARSRRGRPLRGRRDVPAPRRHSLLPHRGRRPEDERGERLRPRVLLQRRGLLRRGHGSLWLAGLDRSWAAATNPALPPEQQQQALAAYAAGASIPYAGGLGLRRHYLHASWTRGGATSVWTGAVRTVVGLDDGAFALTPGRRLGAARQRHAERRRDPAPRARTRASTASPPSAAPCRPG